MLPLNCTFHGPKVAVEGPSLQLTKPPKLHRMNEMEDNKRNVFQKVSSFNSPYIAQKSAMMFGGDDTARGWFNGLDVQKKVQRLSFLQSSANRSKSNISPIGIPQPPRQ